MNAPSVLTGDSPLEAAAPGDPGHRHPPGQRLLLAIGAALALVACGGPAPHQTAGARDAAAPIWHRLVQCARQNGMPDLPEPTIDDRGQAHFPGGTPSPPPSVQQACQAIYDQLPAQARGDQSPDPALMRQFAQCMRSHGIQDWPDPDAQGQFHMPQALDNIKSGPRAQQIRAAWMGPCSKYNPDGRIYTAP